MNRSAAEIVCEYGPFPGVDSVHGVTHDGQQVWFAAGDKLNAFDPSTTTRSLARPFSIIRGGAPSLWELDSAGVLPSRKDYRSVLHGEDVW